jgi:hypothetical protein
MKMKNGIGSDAIEGEQDLPVEGERIVMGPEEMGQVRSGRMIMTRIPGDNPQLDLVTGRALVSGEVIDYEIPSVEPGSIDGTR